MKIKDVYTLIDRYAPFSLSENYCAEHGWYDNSGVIISHDDDVSGICFSLDCTSKSVEFAVKNGCNLLVTHHPAIFDPVKRVDGNIYAAARAGLGIISCHLNLDFAEKGVDYSFAERLGAASQTIIEKVGSGGYGRLFSVDCTFGEFISEAERALSTKALCFGDVKRRIKTVASFCGAGLETSSIDEADADLYCSADVKHHVLTYALDRGKCVISFTHYASEIYGIINLYRHFLALKEIKEQNMKLCFFDDKRYVPSSEKE